jgi:hypothetical protein
LSSINAKIKKISKSLCEGYTQSLYYIKHSQESSGEIESRINSHPTASQISSTKMWKWQTLYPKKAVSYQEANLVLPGSVDAS